MDPHPNRYSPPAAPVSAEEPDEPGTRSSGLKWLAIAVAATATLTAGLAPAALESFRQLFAGFGAELPLLSRIALGGMWIWTLLAAVAVGVAIWIGSTGRASRVTLIRMRVAVALLAISILAFFVVSLMALYLPIFRLGDVV